MRSLKIKCSPMAITKSTSAYENKILLNPSWAEITKTNGESTTAQTKTANLQKNKSFRWAESSFDTKSRTKAKKR